MNKSLIRFIAPSLILCLITDPVTASAISSQRPVRPVSQITRIQSRLQAEAFEMPLVFPLHALGTSALSVRHNASEVAHNTLTRSELTNPIFAMSIHATYAIAGILLLTGLGVVTWYLLQRRSDSGKESELAPMPETPQVISEVHLSEEATLEPASPAETVESEPEPAPELKPTVNVEQIRFLTKPSAKTPDGAPKTLATQIHPAVETHDTSVTHDPEKLINEAQLLLAQKKLSNEDRDLARAKLKEAMEHAGNNPIKKTEIEIQAILQLAKAWDSERNTKEAKQTLLEARDRARDNVVPVLLRLDLWMAYGGYAFLLKHDEEAERVFKLCRDVARGLAASKPSWPPEDEIYQTLL